MPEVVHVSLGKYGFFDLRADASEVSAGEVIFYVTNYGSITHEMIVVKTDLSKADFDSAVAAGQTWNEGDFDVRGGIEDLPKKRTGRIALDLEEGNYILTCNLPGHT